MVKLSSLNFERLVKFVESEAFLLYKLYELSKLYELYCTVPGSSEPFGS